MAKSLNMSGAGAIRTILKNKEKFNFDLRSETPDGDLTSRVYDVFYENSTGTFTIVSNDAKKEVEVAALNFNMGKVINLHNDANIRKLAEYVLENTK